LDYAAGSASVVVSDTAPEEVELGSIWFNSAEGRSYIYYDGFFVELTPSIQGPVGPQGIQGEPGEDGAAGATGPSGVIAVTAPITNSGTSTSANIGIDRSQLASVSGNAIINGAFEIDQRNNSGTSATAGRYLVDRFPFQNTNALTNLTTSRSTDAPSGIPFSLLFTTTTQKTSPASSDLLAIQTSIEASDFQNFGKGVFLLTFAVYYFYFHKCFLLLKISVSLPFLSIAI
jgi:hypothetical protein